MFIEREENVKADIFLAYRALLAITKPTVIVKRGHSIAPIGNEMDTTETRYGLTC